MATDVEHFENFSKDGGDSLQQFDWIETIDKRLCFD